jgi:hypothetical protein
LFLLARFLDIFARARFEPSIPSSPDEPLLKFASFLTHVEKGLRRLPCRSVRSVGGSALRLRRKAETFSVDLTPPHWYDLWHVHFDWHGHSRGIGRARRAHLNALFTAFRRALRQAADARTDVQTFVSIAPPAHAEQDALYVHTPNPNGSSFPHRFDDVQWGLVPPPILRAFVEGEVWDVGALGGDRAGWWVIRPRDTRVDPSL